MQKWLEIATENILLNSVNKIDFNSAKEEWLITEKVIDNYVIDCNDLPCCELCCHEKLRWQFEIQNKLNGNKLLVGSTCITKFDIPVSTNNAAIFHGKIRDDLLLYRIRLIKDQYVKNHIKELFKYIKERVQVEKIEEIEKYWINENCLTPDMAVAFISLCIKTKLNIQELEITISIKRIDEKIGILHMKNEEYEIIKPYLDEKQVKRCNEIRKKT
jgi:hypothetical protein